MPIRKYKPTTPGRRQMTVMVFDDSGRHDLFSVSAIQGSSFSLTHNLRDSTYMYQPGVTRIVEARMRTYFLKSDAATGAFQLEQHLLHARGQR